MSDFPSVPTPEIKDTRKSLANWINANVVLQKILQSLDAEDRSKIVLRCDDLPLVAGDEKDLEDLFRGLLQMILQKKGEVPTLFLHISCAADEQPLPATTASRFFTIQFNTNIVPSTDWFAVNQERLNKFEAVVTQCKGSLVTNAFKSSGCIFSVSLPGKVE
jgi:hypothetical protein